MRRILIQLDTDPHPSTFDRVVAVDAGINEVFSYGAVTPQDIELLVHGAMFTRGPQDLNSTAIFIGGADVTAGEKLLEAVTETFFGPVRVSVMVDSNGSNTTAAAAVLAARKHVSLSGTGALVLAATGPVGQRAVQLLAMEGASVRVASRSLQRAEQTCDAVTAAVPSARLTPCETASDGGLESACRDVVVIIAAGAAGVELLPAERRRSIRTLKVAIDLNAIPPSGLTGVEMTDRAVERNGAICYGAIGVGGRKMKIHKAALQKLFEENDQVLDTEVIYRIGAALA